MSKIVINDLIDELKHENIRLSNELLNANKCVILFEKYRDLLNDFCHKCDCVQNNNNKSKLSDLENDYKSFINTDSQTNFNNSVKINKITKFKTTNTTIKRNVDYKRKLYSSGHSKQNTNNVRSCGRKYYNCRFAECQFRADRISRLNVHQKSHFNGVNQLIAKLTDRKINEENVNQTNRVNNEINNSCDIIVKPETNDNGISKTDAKIYEEIVEELEQNTISGVKTKKLKYFRCNYSNCEYKSDSKRNTLRHISKIHSNNKQIICDLCETKFWKISELTKHYKTVHFTNFNQERKTYKCDWNNCEYECRCLAYLKMHKRRHIGDKPFKCDISGCNSSFVNIIELRTHNTRKHSDDLPFHCEWPGCESGFKIKSDLKAHMFSHTGNYPFRCDYAGCGMNFVNNRDLKYHELSHTNELPFKCEWPGCEAAFKSKGMLKIHAYTHTGERPIVCDWPGCDARFYSNSHLKRHKYRHDSFNSFSCDWPECKRTFKTKYNLKLHLMVHKGEKPFKCELWPKCQKSFKEKFRMIIHVQKMHSN